MTTALRSRKRPNYFTGQLLGQEDFLDEQNYQISLHRDASRLLHTWGVVMGLEVSVLDATTILIKPGTALDAQGHLIVLDVTQNYSVSPRSPGAAVYLTISYDEKFEDTDRSTDSTENFTRWTELCVLSDLESPPPDDGTLIVLAKVQFSGGRLDENIDVSLRREAGARLASRSVTTSHLANASVTAAKLAADLRGGWVHTAFKPSPFMDAKGGATAEGSPAFSIYNTRATCEDRGARGTMAVPIPILADRIVAFMIAGAVNAKGLHLVLELSWWDTEANKHRAETILDKQLSPRSPFHDTFPINRSFDRGRDALSVYIHAAGSVDISIIGVQFDLSLSR
jgi:hypothetical protein